MALNIKEREKAPMDGVMVNDGGMVKHKRTMRVCSEWRWND